MTGGSDVLGRECMALSRYVLNEKTCVEVKVAGNGCTDLLTIVILKRVLMTILDLS